LYAWPEPLAEPRFLSSAQPQITFQPNDRLTPVSLSSSSAEADSNAVRRPRFVVGIDLGTTNSALCFIDTELDSESISTFLIPQVVAAGQVESQETLPSFRYEALPDELKSGATRLPWRKETPDSVVGVFARDHGRTIPGRMIESAKSWLCHSGVDRKAALLPWHGAADVRRVSPVEASASYLGHLREAWNAAHPEHPLEQQDVVLTIPASFDEVARELTVAAARMAGLFRVILLEEPQAAFYSWVAAHRQTWETLVAPGQTILVCDIGGGTSDFSLIHVRSGEGDRVQFHRVAVGDHLLLGGDNLDLALAHHLEQKLANGGRLDARQWSMLIPACRHAKETLLGEHPPESHTVVLAGGGSKLIGGSLRAELTREEVLRIFVDGFLPTTDFNASPAKRQSGFQEFGLPYATDPAITRYLATFLRTHAQSDASESMSDVDRLRAARPDIVLFNGGFFASPLLRQRLIESLEQWFQSVSPGWTPMVLRNDRLDLAVAQGAACFGMVRRGVGVRITAGLARTYYIAVEQPNGSRAAMCLIPAGTEASTEHIVIDRVFRVRTSEPVEFPILVSGTRLTDKSGQLIPIDPEQLTSLPPIRTVLTTRKRSEQTEVDVRLTATLTEIGTMELWCQQIDGTRRWQLQFDIRPATETDRTAHTGVAEQSGIVDDDIIDEAITAVRQVFSSLAVTRPEDAMTSLSEAIGTPRDAWPPSLLRHMWSELMLLQDGRKRSPQHEARWLNLVGFCLRPGFGMAADDWRVDETWRAINGRLIHGAPACLAELRTLCRRISGGMTAGRQNQIASAVMPAIRQRFRQVQTGRGKAAPYASGTHEAAEIWRMLGSLELLDVSVRQELGMMMMDLQQRAAFEPVQNALIWAVGRVGGRIPVYGPLNLVLPISTVSEWIEQLLRTGDLKTKLVQFTLMQLSRRTQDRFRDIDESLRHRVLSKLKSVDAAPDLLTLIEHGGTAGSEVTSLILGESLPVGLRLL
jgi:molecular chaperone DnaK (HSP70)